MGRNDLQFRCEYKSALTRVVEKWLDSEPVSDKIQIEAFTVIPAECKHSVNDLRCFFNPIPFQQMKKGFCIGCGPE
jgi:hypothetical protein